MDRALAVNRVRREEETDIVSGQIAGGDLHVWQLSFEAKTNDIWILRQRLDF